VNELLEAGFDAHLEWSSEGATLLAGACPVLVVVDVLRSLPQSRSGSPARLVDGAFIGIDPTPTPARGG
jgi:hypothetical protein